MMFTWLNLHDKKSLLHLNLIKIHEAFFTILFLFLYIFHNDLKYKNMNIHCTQMTNSDYFSNLPEIEYQTSFPYPLYSPF